MAKGKTLREHAAYELTRAGLVDHKDPEARKVASDTMALIIRFEKQNHTDSTKEYVLDFFQRLCEFIPLTSLTDDPKEWEKFTLTKESAEEGGEKITEERWMSKRSPRIMSSDAGKTWVDMPTGKTGTSIDHVKYEADMKKAKENEAKAEKAKAEVPAGEEVEAPTPVDPNQPATKDDLKTAKAAAKKKPTKKGN